MRENQKKTADLSTPLRSGRDDNFVAVEISCFSWKRGSLSSNKIVVSTGAQRSGEICGFLPVLTKSCALRSGPRRKLSLGCARRFRPTYASANVGHPSSSLRLSAGCFKVGL